MRPPRRRTETAVFAVLIALLVGCGGEPRYPVVSAAQARLDTRPHTLRVLRVIDGLEVPRALDCTHLIEAEVLDGPPERVGQRFAFAYDDWNRGQPPPHPGERITVTPAEWVLRLPSSRGRPMRGWEAPETP